MAIRVQAPELVGREEELRRIEAFLDGATNGSAALLVEGDAGIGKTTLWQAGVTGAERLGYQVLTARPTEVEHGLSFAALGDLLAGVHDEIGSLPAPQRRALRVMLLLEESTGTPPDERAIGTALTGLLERVAQGGRVLVALDDVQWLDETTRTILQFALRRAPVTALLSKRAGGADFDLDGLERLIIPPLSLAELNDLLDVHVRTRFLRPTLLEIERTSGGNPFFAIELARELVSLPEPLRVGEPLPVPRRLGDLVGTRFDRLSRTARDLALLAASSASPRTTDLAAEDPGAFAELVAASLLVTEGDRARFAHPILAAAAYDRASATERRSAHRRLAATATDPEDRAYHLAAAAEAPDSRVATALDEAAARAATRGAPGAAARLAARAVELTPLDHAEDLHRRRLAAADAWLAAGEPANARAALNEALAAATGRARGEALLHLAQVANAADGPRAVLELADRALRDLGEREADLRGEFQVLRSEQLMMLGEHQEAEAAARIATAAAENAGDRSLLSRALAATFWLGFVGGQGEDLPLIRRAIELEDATASWDTTLASRYYVAFLSKTHQVDAARELALQHLERVRGHDDGAEARVLMDLGWFELTAGRWAEAERYAAAAIELSRQTGRVHEEAYSVYLRARVHVERGEVDDATRDAEEVLRAGELLGSPQCTAYGRAVLKAIAFTNGDYGEVVAIDRDAATAEPAILRFLPSRVEALVALGRLDEARAILDPYEERCRALERWPYLAEALRCRGLIAAAEGDRVRAAAAFDEALSYHDRLNVQYERGRTLLAYGSMLRRARQRTEAKAKLSDALAIFDGLGAQLWAGRARSELEQLGGRPPQAGKLSATEERIAQLVARGRSNAEVAHELSVSPKTVEWNLSKIYKKLHVRGRAELAAKLARPA